MAGSSIAVIGLGSIGGIVAGSLGATGRHDVVACVRSPIAQLTVERPEDVVETPLASLTDPAAAAPVDWVLLATKAYHTAAAAPWLARLCGPGTRIAVLQNGIGHAERLAPFAGPARVVPTVVYFNGERLAPDRVRLRRAGPHEIAVADDADGSEFAALFDGTPIRMLRSPDFLTLAWRKLLINIVANPVTCLTLRRQHVLRRDDIQTLCLALLDEAVAVARADGARVVADEPARIMATLMTYPVEAGTSMYFDRLANRPLEADALTGSVVAAGARHGVPTPLNMAFLTLLRAISDS